MYSGCPTHPGGDLPVCWPTLPDLRHHSGPRLTGPSEDLFRARASMTAVTAVRSMTRACLPRPSMTRAPEEGLVPVQAGLQGADHATTPVPPAKWNEGTSFPIEAGHPCLGCSEPELLGCRRFLQGPADTDRGPIGKDDAVRYAVAGVAAAAGLALGALSLR